LNGEASSPLFLISYLINVILGYNVAWALAQRYLSVPDERGARKMALLCAGLSIVGPMLWILPMMASRVIFPNIDALWPSLAVPAEASFVSLALMLLPHGMIGFVVSAILSATLGQANDAFNWLAATLTKDVYVPMRSRFHSVVPGEREQLVFARATMLVVGILGIAVAMYIPKLGGAFNFALQYYSLTAAFMMPVALGMVYTRTPWWSGIASCTAAVGVGLTLMALGVWSDNAFARNILSESFAASVVFFGSAFWFKESDPRHAEIFALERDFATPAADDNAPTDRRTLGVYRLLGLVCLLLGGVLTVCLLVPASDVAPALINPIGGALLILLGGLLMYVSRDA
jgi:SSS family solute:Na+ symporter